MEVDQINAPQRPLPAGILTPAEVMALGLLTAILGLATISFFVIRLLRSQTPGAGRRAMRGLYLSGSLGLLAFLIGSLVTR